MNIFANTVVTLTFELFDADNTLLESTDEPIVYLHGGFSGMPPKLEESLEHKKAGESRFGDARAGRRVRRVRSRAGQDRIRRAGCRPTSRRA